MINLMVWHYIEVLIKTSLLKVNDLWFFLAGKKWFLGCFSPEKKAKC